MRNLDDVQGIGQRSNGNTINLASNEPAVNANKRPASSKWPGTGRIAVTMVASAPSNVGNPATALTAKFKRFKNPRIKSITKRLPILNKPTNRFKAKTATSENALTVLVTNCDTKPGSALKPLVMIETKPFNSVFERRIMPSPSRPLSANNPRVDRINPPIVSGKVTKKNFAN